MIDIDSILLEFVRANLVTLGLVLAILKVIAKHTEWAVDDEIIQIFTNFLKRKEILSHVDESDRKLPERPAAQDRG